jgi:NCAIR mutase (PurE)-related protein
MDKYDALALLRAVEKGEVSPEDALIKLRIAPFEDLGFAKVDYHRELRQGIPEVIFGQGKTPEQIAKIVQAIKDRGGKDILITRMSKEAVPAVSTVAELSYCEIGRVGVACPDEGRPSVGSVVVASGGTADISVCEEAAITATVLGSRVTRVYDVGVAGLHRLLSRLDVIMSARAVIAVAGMEGALASVIGGLVDCPVIAVPTSVGYGASLGGLSALLSMLNSCASGVSVVNIDNGFGAGYLASMINRMEGIK